MSVTPLSPMESRVVRLAGPSIGRLGDRQTMSRCRPLWSLGVSRQAGAATAVIVPRVVHHGLEDAPAFSDAIRALVMRGSTVQC